MEYVIEFISEDDHKKFGMEEIEKKYFIVERTPSWTVSRDKTAFLRYAGNEREELSNRLHFQFCWQGGCIPFQVDAEGAGVRNKFGWRKYRLFRMLFPEGFCGEKDVVLDEIRGALRAYGELGAYYATPAECSVEFDF